MRQNNIYTLVFSCFFFMLMLTAMPRVASAVVLQEQEAEKKAEETTEGQEPAEGAQAQEAGEQAEEMAQESPEQAMPEGEPMQDMHAMQGTDLSPEELKQQLVEAKMAEVERHEKRMARIEEIRTHATEDANEAALERLNALVEKEQALHAKKMAQIEELEMRHNLGVENTMQEAVEDSTGADAMENEEMDMPEKADEGGEEGAEETAQAPDSTGN